MALLYNQKQSPFVKIVYSQVMTNGKVQLVPLQLYADGSLRRSQ